MNRNPINEYFKDPDEKAKLFVAMAIVMIVSTISITIGTIIFIMYLVGII